MVCKKKFCDKKLYYKNQALKGGALDIKRFSTLRRQKGYGVFSNIAKRFAIPIIKFLGKEALKGGTNILSEIIPGISLAKKNLKRKAVSSLRTLGDTIEQSGIGRKKRRKISTKRKLKGSGRPKKSKKSKKTNKITQRDIFKTF